MKILRFLTGTLIATIYCSPLLAQDGLILPDFSAATFSNPLNIDNPYHPLMPGQKRTYLAEETDPETGEVTSETIEVEVLNETRNILGIDVRVIRDRVIDNDLGLPIEDTFDFFAQDDVGNVWYFGEEVTDFIYDDEGNLIETTHPGQWQAGLDGAVAGHQMPAIPELGPPYRQEFLEGEAEDVGQIIGVGETRDVAGFGTFENVVRTRDTSVLDPAALEHKFYAPGIGKIATDKIDPVTGAIRGGERLISFVPEPGSNILFLLGSLSLLALRRKRSSR